MKKDNIPDEILEMVEAELREGESTLWVGQPQLMRFLWMTNRRTHPLLTAAVGLGILLFLGSLLISLTLSAVMLGLMLLTAIIGGIVQPLWEASRTVYAVTNQRALVIDPNGVETISGNTLRSFIKRKRASGTGDIAFSNEARMRNVATGFGFVQNRLEQVEHGFFGIDNPDQVELLLLNTFEDDAPDSSRLQSDKDEQGHDLTWQDDDQAAAMSS